MRAVAPQGVSTAGGRPLHGGVPLLPRGPCTAGGGALPCTAGASPCTLHPRAAGTAGLPLAPLGCVRQGERAAGF